MPEADAIVILSGGRVPAPGDPPLSEWRDADRFFGGIDLYRAGRAPLLIFTGGWAQFDEEWHPIVRYDCSHGFLHRDVMFPGGKREKHPLDIPDLNSAFLYAEQDIKDRWSWF
jgi:hypothetical protein